jgi:threonine dehydrogenase-like Zn-dependent dehydrogenase
MRRGAIAVDDFPEPEPAFGHVLVQVKACGICGSDLHFVEHAELALAVGKEMEGTPQLGGQQPELDLDRDVFMGHEFAAEVLEPGPDTVAPPAGTLVTSLPVLLSMNGLEPIVYSNRVLGGYGERMLLSAPMLIEVPNGLDARHAALTEPMAVGLHAVNKAGIQAGDGAVVLGSGPVGLAVIAALKLRNVEPIVAADFSPARRRLAEVMGAHESVDPRDESAFAAWGRVGGSKPLVVFEAIGVPGIINDIMRAVPAQSRVVVVGVCMERDTITPFFGIAKELNIQFVLGYDPMEFARTLQSIAEGKIDVTPMITGEVDLDGVPGAFADLKNPERHCKILVTP